MNDDSSTLNDGDDEGEWGIVKGKNRSSSSNLLFLFFLHNEANIYPQKKQSRPRLKLYQKN